MWLDLDRELAGMVMAVARCRVASGKGQNVESSSVAGWRPVITVCMRNYISDSGFFRRLDLGQWVGQALGLILLNLTNSHFLYTLQLMLSTQTAKNPMDLWSRKIQYCTSFIYMINWNFHRALSDSTCSFATVNSFNLLIVVSYSEILLVTGFLQHSPNLGVFDFNLVCLIWIYFILLCLRALLDYASSVRCATSTQAWNGHT